MTKKDSKVLVKISDLITVLSFLKTVPNKQLCVQEMLIFHVNELVANCI